MSSFQIPTAPGALPIVGHILPLARDPWRFLNSLPAYGDVVRIRIGPMQAVVVCDPALTRQVLLEDHLYDKGGPIFERDREVVGDGVATCPHSRHRRQRRLVQSAFHPDRLPGYAQAMTEQITTVIDSWYAGQVFDVYAEMTKITARIAIATMFAGSLTPTVLEQILADLPVVVDGVYRQALMPEALTRVPIPSNRRFYRARDRMRHALAELIADHGSAGADQGDVLSALVTAENPSLDSGDGQSLSDTEIVDQAITFFIAGAETTATALAWALHFVAMHPNIERRLRTEVDAVHTGRTAAYADLPQLELTGRVISETLRIRPPAWFLTRVTTSETHLGKYTLPAGTTVAYSPYLIQHRPNLFTEPERFNPDRFDRVYGSGRRYEDFLTFGHGARICIGDRFGVIEATLALASITARARLEPVPGRPVRPALALIERPDRALMRVATVR
ncbi:cytochrome P450 [Nocardia sp. CS682]|nr:cytochrome P450 [Nocardia sp. CS682]